MLSTAGGLVFQGSATGYLNAYDLQNGQSLWQYPAQTGIVAPPVSYEVDGEQYISVSVGWGGIFPLMTGILVEDAVAGDPINRSRLLTFKLNGQAQLPETVEQQRTLPDLSYITNVSPFFAIIFCNPMKLLKKQKDYTGIGAFDQIK